MLVRMVLMKGALGILSNILLMLGSLLKMAG